LDTVAHPHPRRRIPLADATAVFALIINLMAIIVLLSIVLEMPMGIPSENVDVTEIVSQAFIFDHC
jgi:hypothetical protein